MEELKKLKVVELKERLTALQLPVTGKKEELVARLFAATPAPKSPTSPKRTPAAAPSSSSAAAVANTTTTTATNNAPEKSSGAAASQARAAVPAVKTTPVPGPVAQVAATAATAGAAPSPVSALSATSAMDEEKRRLLRAQRFGLPVTASPSTADKQSKSGEAASKKRSVAEDDTTKKNVGKNAAAATSKSVVATPIGISPDVLKRRAEKFGLTPSAPTPATSASVDDGSAVKKQRTAPAETTPVVLSAEEQLKMQKRADRFAVVPPTATSPTASVPPV